VHGAQCSCAVTWGKQSLPISTFVTDSTDGTVTKEADKQNEITVRADTTTRPHPEIRVRPHRAPEGRTRSTPGWQHARPRLQLHSRWAGADTGPQTGPEVLTQVQRPKAKPDDPQSECIACPQPPGPPQEVCSHIRVYQTTCPLSSGASALRPGFGST